MKKTIAILLVAVMALSFVACSAKNKLVGTWEDGKDKTFKFNKDGSGEFTEGYSTEPFKYKVDGNKLTIDIDGEELTMTFKINGNTLTLEGGSGSLELTKK